MDTYSSSSDSAYGPDPEANLTADQIDALLENTADLGEAFANENFQTDSQYHIPTPHWGSPAEVVPMQDETMPVAQAASSQDHPDGYISFLNLWYDIANGPDGGAHYLRQIRWHHPKNAPAFIPQWPSAAVARAAVDGDPDGYNPTLKIWYNMTTAQAPGADYFREIGWHTIVSAPAGMPQEAATPITAPIARPQLPIYRPAPAPRPAPARSTKGRNPKKNSIIQKCICKPQYSTIDVPRPPNMFILFRSQESMKIQHESVQNGGVKITHDKISKIVGERWHTLSDAARAPYKAQADRLAEEHKIKYPGWSFKPGMKNAHQFGSISCTCGAYQINVAARNKRAEQALAQGEIETPIKKRGRGPGRKRKQREYDDESEDEQPTPKRSTRSKAAVRYAGDDESDSLFMPQGDEIMDDAPAEEEYYEDVAPVLAMPSRGRRSPPAPIMTMPASPPLTRSAGKEPTPLKTADFNDLFAEIVDYSAPFDIPTSARSSRKSSRKASVAPATPRRSIRLSSREAL